MSKRVLKYKIMPRPSVTQTLPLPLGAQILDVQEQNGGLVLWALLDPGNPPEDRKIYLAFTGDTIPTATEYLTTVQFEGLVYHVFLPQWK